MSQVLATMVSDAEAADDSAGCVVLATNQLGHSRPTVRKLGGLKLEPRVE